MGHLPPFPSVMSWDSEDGSPESRIAHESLRPADSRDFRARPPRFSCSPLLGSLPNFPL
jgi:hypothetical protein